MRKLSLKKITVFVAVMLLFIAGNILGTLLIRHLFFEYKKNELEPLAKHLSSEYAENPSNLARGANKALVAIFDIYGNEVTPVNIKEPRLNFDMHDTVKKFLPPLIAGKTISSIEEIKGLPDTSVVIGVPVQNGNIITGALFVLIPATDIKAALKGFTLVFTVTLFLGLAIIGALFKFYIRETRGLEQTRKDYVANVSHELKSPVSSIKALTETLADNVITDEDTRQKYYGIMLRETARMQNLIYNMLELSQLQSGNAVIKKQKINTRALLEEVFNKYSVIANDLGINLMITDKAWNAPDIFSSKSRLLQLFFILIDNAVKFVGENGEIIISAKTGYSELIFEVTDNGIGIKPDVLPHIFERFYKEDTSRNTDGSGLGLSIAREIITALHEKISVKSEYGKGTTFTFSVKRAQ